ncbi:M36 family metallopeptidase [Euzebya rosea]|uniref:M36 family metallopeptidase n=1 Tax=Euzebya rosea TaxID=2052804 RepID=UPI000D3E7D2A|nr:M36 family metallopeptidase [Euzebya rosea]
MRIPPIVALLVLALMAVPLGVQADQPIARRAAGVEEVREGLLGGDLGPAVAPEVALAAVADRLEVDAEGFAFDFHRTSLAGEHFRGRQVIGGVPVDGTAVAVHVIEGRVAIVEARDTDAVGSPVATPVTAATAEAAVLGAFGVTDAIAVDSERLLVPTDGVLVDTWRVGVVAPEVAVTVDVSAADATILEVGDDRLFANATATLFSPNPIATSGHIDMRQDVDVAGVDVDFTTDSRVAKELRDLPIRDFDLARAAAGNLVGPWVDVIGGGPMVPVLDRFDVTKTDPRFEGLMAYHHIDAIQRYFRDELGLDDINAEPQLTVALPVMGFDNSFYQPANDLVLFGAGGVDDGEDAEVIIHELGHAIHDDQVPGWGKSAEGGAMGEGFGDFLAASYYATFDDTLRTQDTCLMEWDSTSYSSEEQTCIRRMDTTKTYADRVGQVHADGEIWSKFLWNVREHLGQTEDERSANVLTWLLTAHFSTSDRADFAEAIRALEMTVDSVAPDAETAAEWDAVLYDEAVAMGMPIAARPGASTGS